MQNMFTTRVKTPSDYSAAELAAFCQCVNLAGEVDDLVPGRVTGNGLKLIFVYRADTLAGVGALKKPDPGYHQRCFRNAAVPDRWADFPMELGWINSVEEFQPGMSRRIIDPLLAEPEGHGPLYATVRSDNPKMIYSLRNRGFATAGNSYASKEHPGAQILLFVRGAVA